MCKPKTMKIFQEIRKNFAIAGIYGAQKHRFNRKNSLILAFLAEHFVSTAIVLLFQAKSIREYTESFYGCATGLSAMVILVSNIFEAKHLLDMIISFESVIKQRRFYLQ